MFSMRAASTNKDSTGFFRVGDTSEVGGLVLGGDYCAEHESGIEELRREFGISSKAPPGIERYRISGLSSRSALVFCDRPDLDQSILCCSHPSNVSQLVGKPGITGGLATRHEGFDPVVANRLVAFRPTWRDKDDRVRVLPVHSKAADREAWKAYNAGIIGTWSERSFMVGRSVKRPGGISRRSTTRFWAATSLSARRAPSRLSAAVAWRS